MICAASLIPLGDAIASYAHQNFDVPISFMAWSRFALGAVLIAPFALRRGVTLPQLLRWQVLARGLAITLTVWCILQAVALAPIADVYGAFFIAPVLSFIFAVVFLRERPSALRVVLILCGFLGVMLVVKPTGGISLGMGLALLSGVFYGIYLTTNRWLAGRHKGLALLWAQFIVGAVVMAPFGIDPGAATFGFGLALCVLLSASTSAGANLMIVEAYRLAEATRLAPLVYVQLIGATLYGIVFFGTFPDFWSIVGLTLLVLSGFAALALRSK